MLEAVTLDFWGTLVDGRHDLSAERIDALASLVRGHSRERIQKAYRAANDEFFAALRQGFGLRAATMLSTTLGLLDATLSPPEYEITLRHWEEALLASPPCLLEGIPELLRELRASGLLVGLISDTGLTPGRVVRRMLQEWGLLAQFDWLTFSSDTGISKARPYAFSGTLRALGTAPARALHVGDTEVDMRGAHAVGMRAALVLESNQRRDLAPLADLVLERIRDLPAALHKLEGD
jgi:putative hydrolase of the HAD superfamily